MMNRRPFYIAFIICFLCIIFSVSLIQVVYEVRSGQTIQVLDLLTDMVITPVNRNRVVKERVTSVNNLIDSLTTVSKSVFDADEQQCEGIAEDLLFACQDLRKELLQVNRHVNDDTAGQMIVHLDNAIAIADSLFNDILDNGFTVTSKKQLDDLKSHIVSGHYSSSLPAIICYPALILKSLFAHTLFSQDYLREYEEEMEERSLIALSTRPLMRALRYHILRDYGSKAVAGKDQWLFYKPGYDYLVRPYVLDRRSMVVDYNDKALTDNPIRVICNFKDQLARKNIDLLVVIVPGKSSVYPELINGTFPLDRIRDLSHSRRILRELAGAGVDCVNLFDPFLREKQNNAVAGDSLYLKTDTHWKLRGLRCTAKEVAQRIRQYPWFDSVNKSIEYLLDTVMVDREGDIGIISKLSEFKAGKQTITFPKEKTTCLKVYQAKRDEEGNLIRRVPFKVNFKSSEILVLGDSFSRIYQSDSPGNAGWIAHLAYELHKPLAFLVSDGGASTLVREKLARKKKILKGKKLVVWEFIERDIRYGAEGWKDIKF